MGIDRELRHQRSRALAGQNAEITTTWEPVKTDYIALHATTDPDLIRTLKFAARRPEGDASQMDETSKDALSREKGTVAKEEKSSEKQHAQLLHGGPQGQYERCK